MGLVKETTGGRNKTTISGIVTFKRKGQVCSYPLTDCNILYAGGVKDRPMPHYDGIGKVKN